ncbi:MAG: Rrf2 family transcriptional regulator [Pirellulales bacterium]
MKWSRAVAYAVQATVQLASDPGDRPIPCSKLAAEGDMPERFLLQILRCLVTHGILHSARGVDGGYMMNRGSHEVSLLDVIEAVEGPLTPSVPHSGGLSPASQKRLQKALQEVTAAARKKLKAVKIAELLDNHDR